MTLLRGVSEISVITNFVKCVIDMHTQKT